MWYSIGSSIFQAVLNARSADTVSGKGHRGNGFWQGVQFDLIRKWKPPISKKLMKWLLYRLPVSSHISARWARITFPRMEDRVSKRIYSAAMKMSATIAKVHRRRQHSAMAYKILDDSTDHNHTKYKSLAFINLTTSSTRLLIMNHTVGTYFADVLTLILLSPGCQKRAFQTYVRKAEGRQTMPNVENVATWIRGIGSDVLLCWRLRTLSFLFCPFELPTIKSVVWIEICDTSSDSIQQSALNDSTPRITQVVKSKIKYRATTPPFSRIPKCLNLHNPWRQIQIKFSELDWHYVE